MSEQGIPQSNALAEATTDSLAELMSRDPEGYQRQDRDRIIQALRADRARRAEAEAKAAESGKKVPKAQKTPQEAVKMTATAGDLGL